MTYSKPELMVLGDAVRLIQGGKVCVLDDDGIHGESMIVPAYELDE